MRFLETFDDMIESVWMIYDNGEQSLRPQNHESTTKLRRAIYGNSYIVFKQGTITRYFTESESKDHDSTPCGAGVA